MRIKMPRVLVGLLAGSLLLTGCAASTVIHSIPDEAVIYIDGKQVGTTPYVHRDRKMSGSSTSIWLQKDGYETVRTYLVKDEQPNFLATCTGLLLIAPLFWARKYDHEHTYEMYPVGNGTSKGPVLRSKAERLEELKVLREIGHISDEEYWTRRRAILAESD